MPIDLFTYIKNRIAAVQSKYSNRDFPESIMTNYGVALRCRMGKCQNTFCDQEKKIPAGSDYCMDCLWDWGISAREVGQGWMKGTGIYDNEHRLNQERIAAKNPKPKLWIIRKVADDVGESRSKRKGRSSVGKARTGKRKNRVKKA